MYILNRHSFISSLYILGTCTLLDNYFASIFSQSVTCVFIFKIIFWRVNILILMEFNLLFFCFMVLFCLFFYLIHMVLYLKKFCLLNNNFSSGAFFYKLCSFSSSVLALWSYPYWVQGKVWDAPNPLLYYITSFKYHLLKTVFSLVN